MQKYNFYAIQLKVLSLKIYNLLNSLTFLQVYSTFFTVFVLNFLFSVKVFKEIKTK